VVVTVIGSTGRILRCGGAQAPVGSAGATPRGDR
jgi:hypothetical protein